MLTTPRNHPGTARSLFDRNRQAGGALAEDRLVPAASSSKPTHERPVGVPLSWSWRRHLAKLIQAGPVIGGALSGAWKNELTDRIRQKFGVPRWCCERAISREQPGKLQAGCVV